MKQGLPSPTPATNSPPAYNLRKPQQPIQSTKPNPDKSKLVNASTPNKEPVSPAFESSTILHPNERRQLLREKLNLISPSETRNSSQAQLVSNSSVPTATSSSPPSDASTPSSRSSSSSRASPGLFMSPNVSPDEQLRRLKAHFDTSNYNNRSSLSLSASLLQNDAISHAEDARSAARDYREAENGFLWMRACEMEDYLSSNPNRFSTPVAPDSEQMLLVPVLFTEEQATSIIATGDWLPGVPALYNKWDNIQDACKDFFSSLCVNFQHVVSLYQLQR